MTFRYNVHSDWLKKLALQSIAPQDSVTPRSLSCYTINCLF